MKRLQKIAFLIRLSLSTAWAAICRLLNPWGLDRMPLRQDLLREICFSTSSSSSYYGVITLRKDLRFDTKPIFSLHLSLKTFFVPITIIEQRYETHGTEYRSADFRLLHTGPAKLTTANNKKVNTFYHSVRFIIKCPWMKNPERRWKKLSILAWWIRNYTISRKVAGSRIDEVNIFFSIGRIIPTALGPGVYSASNKNSIRSRKMFLGSRARLVRRAGNLTAICEPIV
jgi:hypothetical protein